jgi:hypothetical protein
MVLFPADATFSFKQRVFNDVWRTMLSRRCMIWLLPKPLSFCLPACRRSSLLHELSDRRPGGGCGRGAKSYDGEKACPSTKSPIPSGLKQPDRTVHYLRILTCSFRISVPEYRYWYRYIAIIGRYRYSNTYK